MNKIAIALSALTFLAAGSVGAMAATNSAIEPDGQPINMAQLPSSDMEAGSTAIASEPDMLSLWANQGVISDRTADRLRAQIEQQGLQPGTFAYDQAASADAFPDQFQGND